MYNRTRGTDCPACAGRVATEWNCLAVRDPEIAAMWDTERNGTFTPHDVTPQSQRKAFFKCANEHSYERSIYQMVNIRGCRYCAGQAATKENNLAVTHPEIAAELHPSKNADLDPSKLLPGSSKRVWWRCEKDHEWSTSPNKRVNRGDGCPHCWTPASRIQLRVFAEVEAVLGGEAELDAVAAGKHIDVWLGDLGIAVELDGKFWHQHRLAHDEDKSRVLSEAGITLIRLREEGLKPAGGDVVIGFHVAIRKGHVDELLRTVQRLTASNDADLDAAITEYLEREEWIAPKRFQQLASRRTKPQKHRSLAYRFRVIADEFDCVENEPVKPTEVYAKANHKAWFQCPTCKRSYRTRISHRTDEGSGCPYCSGHAVAPDQSLAARHRPLMREWHPIRNSEIDPYTLAPQSNKYVWWVCPNGHEYKAPPSRRVGEFNRSGRYSGCDRCYHEGKT
jgi:hypothetical protein